MYEPLFSIYGARLDPRLHDLCHIRAQKVDASLVHRSWVLFYPNGHRGRRYAEESACQRSPAFFLGLAWLYLGTALWKRAGRRAFAGRPELQQDLSVTIDDSGVDFSGPISSWHWTWQAFVRVLESKTTILLMLSPCAFAIFPKRVFGPGELEKFREIVGQKLPLK